MTRQQLAAHLHGEGLDLGPGHMPFPTPDGAHVTLVGRSDDDPDLFPELVGHKFPTIDVPCDFDLDSLSAFTAASQDFVVCSHVLEHLADPIGMLCEIRRVLRPDGVAVLVLPDREQTFDRTRPPTTLVHLILEGGVTVVDDAHIIEFLESVGPQFAGTPLAWMFDDPHDPKLIAWHRRRSVHAHCWNAEEFGVVLDWLGWTIVERVQGDSEFGFVCT